MASTKVKLPLKSRKPARPAKLRSSITPGTVLILLAGHFRGRRVVFLKQLESGLLLVTGPYKCNGIPLKRVNQAYVIATSTKVDISSLKVSVDDALFKKSTSSEKKTSFFERSEPSQEKAVVVDPKRKAAQTEIDAQLLPLIKKTPLLRSYLGARFSLKKGQAPHDMKF